MRVQDLRDHIAAARASLDAGDADAARRYLDLAASQLTPEALLTTSEAAALLGIRSKNTIKAMARRGQIAATRVGARFLIPVAEVARLQASPVLRELQTIERDYDAMAFPGSDAPVDAEEMASLRAGETGTLPWQR